MGLCNEERYAKIYCVIERLTEMVARARGESSLVNNISDYAIKYEAVGRIMRLIDQLWPAFLGRTSNSGHWLFGGESSSDTGNSTSGVLTMAFYLLDKRELTGEKEEDDPLSLKNVPEERRDRIEWMQKYWPDNAVTLLDKNKPEEHFVWETFCWCETYFYAANRYSDEVQAGLADTTALICKIAGLCFKEFSNNDQYLRAWMAKTLLSKVLSYEDDDLVTNWLREKCAHHDIRADYYDGDLYADFRKYRPYHGLPVMERMEIAFKFLGRRFHYEHQHKQLLKLATEAKKTGAKVNIPRIKQMIARCVKLYAEHNERERPYEAYCWITQDTVTHKKWDEDHPSKKKAAKKKAKKKGGHHGVVAAPRKKTAKKTTARGRGKKR